MEKNGRFQPGHPGLKPKGAISRFTRLKEAWADVFEQMGGREALYTWAMGNKKDFFEMMVRLMPKELQVGGEGVGGTKVIIVKDGNGKSNPSPRPAVSESIS